MAWSIAEVARMSGVSSRTLRHYDAMGLVTPAYTGANGYRYYEREQLLRLQRVLLLRELGVGLREIAATLDAEPDIGPGWIDALRRHQVSLLAQRDRLGRLAQTVARTIDELAAELENTTHENEEGESTMTQPTVNRPENLFEGFDASQLEQEARERWPEEAARSEETARGLTPEQAERMQREMTQHIVRMGELMVAGKPADDPAVLDEVDWHYQRTCMFWTPNAAAYAGLGQTYVDDERFARNYERVATGLAAYTRDALAAYAAARL